MDKPNLIAAILTALFVLGLVAFRLVWAGSQLSASLGLRRLPDRWVPDKLKRWLFGETNQDRPLFRVELKLETKTIMDLETAQILHLIEVWQDVQKKNPPSSEKWQEASKALEPLFKEMARRTR